MDALLDEEEQKARRSKESEYKNTPYTQRRDQTHNSGTHIIQQTNNAACQQGKRILVVLSFLALLEPLNSTTTTHRAHSRFTYRCHIVSHFCSFSFFSFCGMFLVHLYSLFSFPFFKLAPPPFFNLPARWSSCFAPVVLRWWLLSKLRLVVRFCASRVMEENREGEGDRGRKRRGGEKWRWGIKNYPP